MINIVEALVKLSPTPVPFILVIFGLAFIFASVSGKIGDFIDWSIVQRIIAAFLGSILLIAGIGIFVIPSVPLSSPPSSTEPVTLSPAPIALKIGYVPFIGGSVYFQALQRGAEQAAKELGVEVITQLPDQIDPKAQSDAIQTLVAKGINALIVAPTDGKQMIPVLEAINKQRIAVITVDTALGDGDYTNGSVTFPLTYISSDYEQQGQMACDSLADAIGKKGKVYIMSILENFSSITPREKACLKVLAAYPDIKVVAVDYNEGNESKAETQTAAILQRNPDLAGIYSNAGIGIEGIGKAVKNAFLKNTVKVVTIDSTPQAIDLLKEGVVMLVIAQKPYDMGYQAVRYAVANARKTSSVPKRYMTGMLIINSTNVNSPDVQAATYK